MVQTSSSSYELQFPNGTRKEFTKSDGATGSTRRIFMTQVIDSAGNAVQLNYDSSLRITNIVDAVGQATSLSYSNVTYPNAITQVTDPFGRSALFQYNAQGLLTQITDVLAITSQYSYGPNEFITNLMTPYGTTTFSCGTTNGGSWLQATDPLGGSELAEAPLNGLPGAVGSDPSATVPTNMPVTLINGYLNFRNTYFWGKQQYAIGAWNPADATIYHFLHTTDINIESGVLESVKQPLENRVWYQYAGTPQTIQLGAQTISRPIAVGRVLDNGSSQTSYYQYNVFGNLTNSTDPTGRNFTYIYSTNNVDLLQVSMTSNGRNELQTTITYNSRHRPLTITDVSGQTTTNTYNTQGQLLSTSDALGEMTTFVYSNGYLVSATGPLQNSSDVVSFTYDGFGRVQTATDTEGYTLTYGYDDADRVTSITHPDGTSEQFVYRNLDLAASADRLGRWTTNTYDADRHLIQTQDPLGRVTQFQYCNCGALEALFDPEGNETSWERDLESRVTAKVYADGLAISYAYENTTSRLKYMTDEKGQTKYYTYAIDNDLTGIAYSNALVATPTVSFAYDTNYNRIVTMQDGIGPTTYTYNSVTATPGLGSAQLASVNGPLPNSMVTYQYDQLGRATNRTINRVAQAVTFDALGRPVTVTNALGSFQYTYVDATARLASEVYPNGQTNLYSYYNNLGDQRLLEIQHSYPNGSLLSGFGYAYNAVGQIIAWTNQWNNLPTRVWLPSYDAVDQLTNVVSSGGESTVTNYAYAYDLAGNRMLAATNGIQTQYYYNALNQIAGSSATLPNVSYEWDAENRLATINQPANSSQFSYDGLGRRVEDLEGTNGAPISTNYYLWCGTEICEQRDANGINVQRRFYPQGETVVGPAGSTNYYYTRDHMGSVREALDSNGLLSSRYDYDPYGQPTIMQENLKTAFTYSGDLLHRPSGLNLTLYRALSTGTGRWLGRDPIGELAGRNLYAYVENNTINQWDSLGLCGNESPSGSQNLEWGTALIAPGFGISIAGGFVTAGQNSGFYGSIAFGFDSGGAAVSPPGFVPSIGYDSEAPPTGFNFTSSSQAIFVTPLISGSANLNSNGKITGGTIGPGGLGAGAASVNVYGFTIVGPSFNEDGIPYNNSASW